MILCITIARKHPAGSVASNVLIYGCGGLNVDESRLPGLDTWVRKGLKDDIRGAAMPGEEERESC